MRNQAAGEEQVTCGGDVMAGLVPEVGQAEKMPVGHDESERQQHKGKQARSKNLSWLHAVGRL